MEWQPIETAPKDGTPILLYCETYPGQILAAVWQDARDGYWGIYQISSLDFDFEDEDEITHWMPLPNPPV